MLSGVFRSAAIGVVCRCRLGPLLMERRYRPLHPLEDGPDTRVYLVEDRLLHRRLVLRLLHPCYSDPANRRGTFRILERRKQLSGSMVPILDLAWRAGRLGVVTERLTGDRLAAAVEGCRSFEDRCGLALRLIECLVLAHANRLFYGCLKPSRFYVENQKAVANLLLPEPLPSVLPTGSIRYMAPEVLDGEEPDERSDVYALGMLLYYVFSGREPFVDRDTESLLRKQRLAYPIPPSQVSPSVAPWLDGMIFDLIDKEPANRPASAIALSTRLEELIRARGTRTPLLTHRLVGRQEDLAQCLKILEKLEPESPSLALVFEGKSGCGKSVLLDLARLACGVWRKRCWVVSSNSPADAAAQLEQLRSLVERPLVLIVDDLQNLDLAACTLLEEITASHGVILFGACNPRVVSSGWMQLRRTLSSRQILVEGQLEPLDARNLKQFLETSLSQQVGEPIVEKMMEVSGGVPSLVVAHLEWLRGTRRLVFQHGRWQWSTGSFEQSALPPAIRQAAQEAISGLQWRPLLALAYLALLDGPAGRGLLESLLELDSDTVAGLVRDLETAGLVVIPGSLAEPQVSLAHRWLSSLIQSRIGHARLAELNLRLARRLEIEYQSEWNSSRLAEMVWHFAEGKDPVKAGQYLLPCLQHLEVQGEYRRARDVIASANGAGVLPAERGEVNRKVIELLLLSGSMSDCLTLCRQMLARNNMTSEERAFVLSSLARVCLSQGQINEATRLCEEALSLSPSSQSGFLADLDAELLCCLVHKGNKQPADKLAERLIRRVKQRAPGLEQASNLHRALYLYYSHFHSRPGKAVSWLLKSIESAIEARRHDSYLRALLHLLDHFVHTGDFQKAERLSREVIDGASLIGNQGILLEGRVGQATVRRKLGLHRQAVSDLQQALCEPDCQIGEGRTAIEVNLELVRNLNALLRPGEAQDCLDRACRQIEEAELFSYALRLKLLRAGTYLTLGKPEGALNLLGDIPLLEANGTRFPLLSLRARANLLAGRLEAALTDCLDAGNSIPVYMIHSRSRNRILQAEISLASGDSERARLILDNLPLDPLSCPPLVAKSHLLHARLLAAEGKPGKARIRALRALQILSHIESPMLELDAHDLLEGIGASKSALGLDSRSLVAGTGARLSPDFQEPGMRRWPHLLKASPSHLPANTGTEFLLELRELARALDDAGDAGQAFSVVLRLLEGSFHEYAPRMVFQGGKAGSPEPDRAFARDAGSLDLDRSQTTVRLPVVVHGHFVAFVALERGGRRLSETQLDFLTCVTAILGKHLEVCAVTGSKPEPDRGPHRFGEILIVGRHPSVTRMIEEVYRVAPTDGNVLLVGESGTGKELVAKAIHHLSGRRGSPFVPVDCSTLPEDLIENELFGHTKGSFTGAIAWKKGLAGSGRGRHAVSRRDRGDAASCPGPPAQIPPGQALSQARRDAGAFR